ncbi:baculoviral IAP repeat-containing protein [Aspergillus thermomutatus]|uniref:Uncharacterized protein n=1 Tax=Aspergillus thermomutatus TaxID=41047 RepID=A0A397HLP4_ASPTH|nr:uncharacterized protein CDV56_100598 [Aspergillus thermomutatus]RHZ62274.1 hypothetical protein CDV56_100598 [Aspergillus thermomutatus]
MTDSQPKLAHAGFYYNPYETNPDNTTCYLCQRALDGWESEDNPITEHLKHSNDCGWAIMMDIEQHSSNPAEIEDPTSDRIAQARQATFGDQWPHDGKRGWTCQSEKVVFDMFSIPKRNFEEHYRRSADCSFFVFAQPPGKKSKTSRSKKSRVSKASSRLSTQSTVSEAPMIGLDNQMDEDDIPQPPIKTKTSKKSSKSKSKTSKSKKDDTSEPDSQMDLDTVEYAQLEPTKPKRTRGKKRASEEMDPDESNMAIAEAIHQSEPPTKKRATKSRNSDTQREDSTRSDVAIADVHEPDEKAFLETEAKKGRAATRKKTSSKDRKLSEDSSVAQAAPEARLPRDSEIDAAIEAELEVGEPMVEEPPAETHKSSKKSKSKKKTKKAAEEPIKLQHDAVERNEEQELRRYDDDEFVYKRKSDVQLPAEQPKPAKSTTKQRSSKEARLSEKKTTESPKGRPATKVDAADVDAEADHRYQGSSVSVEITARNPEPDFEPERRNSGSQTKKATKKSSTSKAKKTSHTRDVSPEPLEPSEAETHASERLETRRSSKPEAPLPLTQNTISPHNQIDVQEQELELEPELEPELEQDPENDIEQDREVEPEEPEAQLEVNETPVHRRSSKVPPKTAERFSDIPQEKQFAKSIAETRTPNSHQAPQAKINSGRQESDAVSPLPSTSKSSPSSSPQSSDAENQPPTIQPSSLRTQLASPSKEKSVRIPLASSTPSPSKRNVNSGALRSLHPWTPIDIDELLYASMSDKENMDVGAALNSVKGDLTSPEKKMTVQEWIFWNARNGEEKLKRECERLVSQFEKEGARAMRTLEGIECID